MICIFIRSSSLNDMELCPGRFWITYTIGRRGGNSRATLIGTIVHAFMESLALVKLAQQDGRDKFTHAEFGEWLLIDYCSTTFLSFIYKKYDEENPNLLQEGDYDECMKLCMKAIEYSGGMFCPSNNDVFAVEHKFDLTLPQDWAKYSYETPNGPLEGQLRLAGTVDIIYKENENTLHVVDYKTSKGIDNWATGISKTTNNLKFDNQLILYYYALAHEFPQYKNILITLYFIRLNKPFTIIFERSELPTIEKLLREKYEEIKDLKSPSWLKETSSKWKCRFCPHNNTMEAETNLSVCDFFRQELRSKGYEKATADNADYSQISSYGASASNPK